MSENRVGLSLTKIDRLMMFKEIIVVHCWENNTEHKV